MYCHSLWRRGREEGGGRREEGRGEEGGGGRREEGREERGGGKRRRGEEEGVGREEGKGGGERRREEGRRGRGGKKGAKQYGQEGGGVLLRLRADVFTKKGCSLHTLQPLKCTPQTHLSTGSQFSFTV